MLFMDNCNILVATTAVTSRTTIARPLPWYKFIIHACQMELAYNQQSLDDNRWLTHPYSLASWNPTSHDSFTTLDLMIRYCCATHTRVEG
jgi:hypothetical protein